MVGPWPFTQWEIDIIGPLPLGKGQTKFTIVAVDYFTKWAEAEPLAKITEQKITDFVWKNIDCRFGIPRTIITDNEKQFDNWNFREMCDNLGIRNVYSSPHHPQTNGQVEAVNKIIKQNLRTKLDRAKRAWADELPKILWAYQTTARTAIGETPFSLAYGSKAITPVEISLPSARVSSFNERDNEELISFGLDLVDEQMEQSRLRMMARQRQVSRFYNPRVKVRRFRAGDMVLRKTFLNTKEIGACTLGPNWEGPYVVSSTIRPRTYRLEDLTG